MGTAKSVTKLKTKTLHVEETRKIQSENLLKTKTFFNLPVEVSEHPSKDIIRDRALKGESENVYRNESFNAKKGHELLSTNTLMLTFNSVVPPKSLKIFYRIIPVEMYVPNPLRGFKCQMFDHYANNCPVDL